MTVQVLAEEFASQQRLFSFPIVGYEHELITNNSTHSVAFGRLV